MELCFNPLCGVYTVNEYTLGSRSPISRGVANQLGASTRSLVTSPIMRAGPVPVLFQGPPIGDAGPLSPAGVVFNWLKLLYKTGRRICVTYY